MRYLTSSLYTELQEHLWEMWFLIICWLRFVTSIKLQVSFEKEPYKRDNILQKRLIILSILLTVATPLESLSVVRCTLNLLFYMLGAFMEWVRGFTASVTREVVLGCCRGCC